MYMYQHNLSILLSFFTKTDIQPASEMEEGAVGGSKEGQAPLRLLREGRTGSIQPCLFLCERLIYEFISLAFVGL